MARIIKYIITFLLFFFTPAFGATYYADTGGSGTTCSIGSPCTLDYAVETKATSGDTVNINDGTYTIDYVYYKNNIVRDMTEEAGQTTGTVPNIVIDYNDFYNNISDDWDGDTDTNTITTDPSHVDPGGGAYNDYILNIGSGCIDTGIYLTKINDAGGSGTSLVLDDVGYFRPGDYIWVECHAMLLLMMFQSNKSPTPPLQMGPYFKGGV